MQIFLDLIYCQFAEVEQACRKRGVAIRLLEYIIEMLKLSASARSDYRYIYRFGYLSCQLNIKSVFRPSQSIEVSSISPAPSLSPSFAHSMASSPMSFLPPLI